jgi:hypothetical protein
LVVTLTVSDSVGTALTPERVNDWFNYLGLDTSKTYTITVTED